MPAHITHEIFAEKSLELAFKTSHLEQLAPYRRYVIFGAQGPDLFLHNHRTHPTGLIFGKLLHTYGYGTFTRHLARAARDKGSSIDSELGAYILGFITHAILDRTTHPYINYFSGWVEAGNPESVRYYNCHAFFERIIDVLVLKIVARGEIGTYDFFTHVDLGEEIPELLLSTMVHAIESTYPEYRGHQDNRKRVQNAYLDTRGFYKFTNPSETENIKTAFARDGGGGDPTRRFLALFHPRALPDMDYLNGAQKRWTHPGDPSEVHNESLIDLFSLALEMTTEPLCTAASVLRGDTEPRDLEIAVGNENLSDGRKRKKKRSLDIVEPLPLDKALSAVYATIAESIAEDSEDLLPNRRVR